MSPQVWLCWVEGTAVGFAIVKPRGSGPNLFQAYAMDILDAIFIR
jgi:hypothetical protein